MSITAITYRIERAPRETPFRFRVARKATATEIREECGLDISVCTGISGFRPDKTSARGRGERGKICADGEWGNQNATSVSRKSLIRMSSTYTIPTRVYVNAAGFNGACSPAGNTDCTSTRCIVEPPSSRIIQAAVGPTAPTCRVVSGLRPTRANEEEEYFSRHRGLCFIFIEISVSRRVLLVQLSRVWKKVYAR